MSIIDLGSGRETAINFTRESSDANLVAEWRPGGIRIGAEWIRDNLILSADDVLVGWPAADPESLELADLEPAIALNPQILIVGTGDSLTLPNADLMAAVAEHGIGLEIMDTPAACRTYNVLIHERRSVVAALMISR